MERSEQVARYAELIAVKVAQVAPVSGGRGNIGGDREASRQLNLDRRDVQRSKKVASLSPEAKRRVWLVEHLPHGDVVPAGADVVDLGDTHHGYYGNLAVREIRDDDGDQAPDPL